MDNIVLVLPAMPPSPRRFALLPPVYYIGHHTTAHMARQFVAYFGLFNPACLFRLSIGAPSSHYTHAQDRDSSIVPLSAPRTTFGNGPVLSLPVQVNAGLERQIDDGLGSPPSNVDYSATSQPDRNNNMNGPTDVRTLFRTVFEQMAETEDQQTN